ncbi:hypothetical protein KFL_001110090 [Klebsormidium nitens]|uniref:Apple domain-containing protein n=1 Tax=Klebsormidium nitens TaxID=105231 RepID=A0A1Y1HXD8_KLENI|nr:hypothetical protein KFL_001110090 [Klebsormidium nitens]|eukprot:GAQ82432.1 hypothetical protein KFL_001110090 [Klebsormidium nitens]
MGGEFSSTGGEGVDSDGSPPPGEKWGRQDYPGFDFLPFAGPTFNPAVCGNNAYYVSEGLCQLLCNAADACVGHVHYAAFNCCYLKSALANATSLATVVSHVKTVSYYAGPNCCLLQSAVGRAGAKLGAAFYSKRTPCEIRCNALDACVGFVHNPTVNCCFLKYALGTSSPNGATSSLLKTGYLGYHFEGNTEYLGVAIPVPAGVATSNVGVYPGNTGILTVAQTPAIIENAVACMARCNSTPGCIAVSHHADNNYCFLKSTVSPLYPPQLRIRNANFYSKSTHEFR